MGLTAHEAAHQARILLAAPKVAAKAKAGNEGCKARLAEYEEQIAKYAAKEGN